MLLTRFVMRPRTSIASSRARGLPTCGAGTDQIRVRRQQHNRQSARAHSADIYSAARHGGDRVIKLGLPLTHLIAHASGRNCHMVWVAADPASTAGTYGTTDKYSEAAEGVE